MSVLRIALTLTLVAAVAAGPAAAQSDPAPGPAPGQGRLEKKERLICRREVETGSIVRARKTCFTREEWDRMSVAGREGAQDWVDQSAGKSTCPGGSVTC